MSDVNTGRKQSGSGRLRLVLVMSLAVNLAVVGVLAGAALRGGPGGGPAEPPELGPGAARARAMQSREFGFGPYLAALEQEQRREIGRAFIGKAGRPDEAQAGAQKKFEAILDTLDAAPFDADLFQTAMLAHLNDLAELQQIGASVIVDYVATMTPEARAAYAIRLDHTLKRPPRPQVGRGGDGPKPKDQP